MKKTWISRGMVAPLVVAVALLTSAARGEQVELPLFDEIIKVLHAQPGDLDFGSLDQAAVDGLVDQLGGRIRLYRPGEAGTDLVSLKAVYEGKYVHFQVKSVEAGLTASIGNLLRDAMEEARVEGIVLDLRQASGLGYREVVEVIGHLDNSGLPVLELNGSLLHAETGGEVLDLPLVTLVGPATVGAAEALASALRISHATVLIGDSTAGRAYTYKEFELKNGMVFQRADGVLKMGDGSLISSEGIDPDIEVQSESAQARKWYQDPFFRLEGEDDGPRINEAELVRRHNQLNGNGGHGNESSGTDAEAESPSGASKPVLQDPVLARGVDLLKGLVLVRQLRQP